MQILPCLCCFLLAQPASDLHFRPSAGGAIEVVAPLDAALGKKLPPGILTVQQGESWLRLCLVDGRSGKTGPPMLGSYRHDDADLVFIPRLAWKPVKRIAPSSARPADWSLPRTINPLPATMASPRQF